MTATVPPPTRSRSWTTLWYYLVIAGLVDLKSAPADVIAWACGVDRSVAEQLVTARTAAGVGFRRVDDVFAWTEIPVDL